MARSMPNFLVCEIKVVKLDGYESRSWFTLTSQSEVDALITSPEQCGFGTYHESVTYQVFKIAEIEPLDDINVKPRTVKDEALRFKTAGVVDIGLRGVGWDPKGVFWDNRGNSFAIVIPDDAHENDARVVSDQGVMLVAVNGIGEVRWTVFSTQAGWPENIEAVKHFGLTWRNP